MEKLKVKTVIRRFFRICDIEDIRRSMWDMHESLMMSDSDLSIEERQRFTFACRQVEDLLNDLDSIREKVERKSVRTISKAVPAPAK